MAREKFDFGIDLGTTNSAIAVMDNGKLKIIKSDVYQKDTTPSRVQFTKKAIRVGDQADVRKGTFIEFKRTMGTDKTYSTPLMDRPYNSEELSSEVLKKLKGYVSEENIQAAVITVPNQFRQNQIDATQRAAELAGFECCELLQEPIAASMAYGIEAQNMKGYWVVFDFGGGTFDAALMKVDEGIMKVVDTGGDNNLGGKDIDMAIVNQILIPELSEEYDIEKLKEDGVFNSLLKLAAEEIKIQLSSKNKGEYEDDTEFEDDEGEEFELDFTVSLDEYEKVVEPIFKKAIDITKDLLNKNNVKHQHLSSVIFVGGPTFSQTLRRMMKEQFDTKIDTTIDPMTSVAFGAALFASTLSIPENLKQRDATKIQLKLKYPETTVELDELLAVKIDAEKSDCDTPDTLGLEISRADGGWTSGKVNFDGADIIELQLIEGKPNVFNIRLSDAKGNQLQCEPSTFTMIQGFKAAKATLPHSICIDSILAESGRQRLVALKGLEKNNTLPAVGKGIFKTQKAIRPGEASDVLTIPMVEGEPGQQSKLNNTCAVVTCSGEDFAALLPEGGEVELTIKVDSSRRITLSAYFPSLDETIDKEVAKSLDTLTSEVNEEELYAEIKKAQHSISFIEHGNTDEISNELSSLSQQLEDCNDDYDAKLKIHENLNVALRKLDTLEDAAEWPKIKLELEEALAKLVETNETYGDQNSEKLLSQINATFTEVVQLQNVRMAKDLIDQIGGLSFTLVSQDIGLWISYIKGFDDDFDSQQWSEPSVARQLINDAKHIISTQPSKDQLQRIVISLFDLLPGKEQPVAGNANTDLLLK